MANADADRTSASGGERDSSSAHAHQTVRRSPHMEQGRLPGLIWILGVVSLCMDASSELVHSLLPIFMGTVLGASTATIGVIEGVAEATASISKVFSGVLSDRVGSRKWLVVFGYGLAAVTKPLFAVAPSVGWVFGARFVDRVGKGIRGAPRDALVADVVAPSMRGAAYGLRQAMDSIGAFVGPLLAVLALGWFAGDLRRVMWLASIPAALAVLLLIAGVREPARSHDAPAHRPSPIAGARALPRPYWILVVLGVVFTLARFSEAFLVLRAQDVGLAIAHVPIVMIVMNVVYAVSAYPAGWLSDRLPARTLLIAGLAVLVVSDLVLAAAGGARPWMVYIGTGLWGLHMGLTQGLFSKLIADVAPARLRGTAFGVYNLASGVAMLVASTLAGVVWSMFGPAATFLLGAAFTIAAGSGLEMTGFSTPGTSRRAHP